MQRKTLNATVAEVVWIVAGFDAVLILSIFALDSSAFSVFLAVMSGILLGVVLAYVVFGMSGRASPVPLQGEALQREYASQQQTVSQDVKGPAQPVRTVAGPGKKLASGVLNAW